MTLTKDDLKAIEKIAEKVVNPKIEELAAMTARQFLLVDKRFDQVDKRFEQIDDRFGQIDNQLNHINIRLEVIETDLSDLKKMHNEVRMIRELLDQVVTFEQHKKLEQRVLRIEKHLGLGLVR